MLNTRQRPFVDIADNSTMLTAPDKCVLHICPTFPGQLLSLRLSRGICNDGIRYSALGNSYISGWTSGDIGGANAGRSDAFVRKFDSDGDVVWTSQIGTSDQEEGHSVAVDALGNVYITGITSGDLGGPSAGSLDAYLAKFDSGGEELWTTHIGSADFDWSWAVAVDAFSGDVYITGATIGDLAGQNAGSFDAFLVKYEVPEPATLGLLALGGIALLRRRKRGGNSDSF